MSEKKRVRAAREAGGAQRDASDVRKLRTLLDLADVFAGEDDLRRSLHRVLERLEEDHGALRAVVALVDPEEGDVELAASIGLTAVGQRARYRIGEGVIGRVVESGKPVVVPKVTREPMLVNRAVRSPRAEGDEYSFFCVPILLNRAKVGALGVETDFSPACDYQAFAEFLQVVGSMVAQALKLHHVVESERQRLLEENGHLRRELKERYDFSNIIGNSGPMRQVYEQVAQVAPTSTTVLIRGESGTGKELIAHAIHYNSDRARKPFVRVNCAALPESLIEAELFGYEKGAFTGAVERKKGRFELADGGTLFLDEIGDLNPSTQVKLLRVLQEREFERVGGTETLKVNVRLIAATNKPLEAAIEEKSFREDLFYRLNVFAIFVPPLRERKPDIMLLADHFLVKYSREHGKNVKRISTPAIDMLVSYHWPGNVRELENTLERAVVVCDQQVVHGHHLPPTLQTAEASGTQMTVSLSDAVAKFEEDMISDALKSTRGNRAKAARLLGSTERIINYKIEKYRIDTRRFRE